MDITRTSFNNYKISLSKESKNFTIILQIRAVFHIAFLGAFARKVRPAFYALKGGINMRLFFNSGK